MGCRGRNYLLMPVLEFDYYPEFVLLEIQSSFYVNTPAAVITFNVRLTAHKAPVQWEQFTA